MIRVYKVNMKQVVRTLTKIEAVEELLLASVSGTAGEDEFAATHVVTRQHSSLVLGTRVAAPWPCLAMWCEDVLQPRDWFL